MQVAPMLSLIVLRVSDIKRSVALYSALGLTFNREKHGTGPEHFSAWVGETVFELYPASERCPATTVRLGFVIESIAAVLAQWRGAGCNVISAPENSPYGLRAVIADPDGYRIELTQRPEPSQVP